MSKPRVAIICENYPPDSGGIAASAERLALSLSSAINVHVFRFPRGDPDRSFSHSVRKVSRSLHIHELTPFVNGWTIPPNPGLRAMILQATVERLVSILTTEKIDIIHGFGLQNAGLVAAPVSHLLSKPLVQSVRGNDVGRNAFDGTRRVELALALVNAKVIVAVNHWAAYLLRMNFPWLTRRIRIISNCVETPTLSANCLSKDLALSLSLPPDGPIVGFVGTLREKKGPHLFSILVRDFISVHKGRLLIIGDIDLELFREIGWSGGAFDRFVIVRRARNRAELFLLISLCDWLIFPSLDDGMANGLLETMACGCPVLCSPVFADVVRNWQDGIIASPLNPSEYVSICEMLWKNQEMRRKMGESARQRIEKDFNISIEHSTWIDLYNEIIADAI